jgi:hypothetical protein
VLRRTGDAGATLVEYAVIVALLVVVSIPAINFLTDRADDQVAVQADCVSMRPPPPSCQAPSRVLPPNPDDDDDFDGIPNKYDDDVEFDIPPEVVDAGLAFAFDDPEPVDVVAWDAWPPVPADPEVLPPEWKFKVQIKILDDEGAPVEGAVCKVRITEVGFPVERTGQTDAGGKCEFEHVTTADVDSVSVAWSVPYWPTPEKRLTVTDPTESWVYAPPATPYIP